MTLGLPVYVSSNMLIVQISVLGEGSRTGAEGFIVEDGLLMGE
jgi:hypothetical protein